MSWACEADSSTGKATEDRSSGSQSALCTAIMSSLIRLKREMELDDGRA